MLKRINPHHSADVLDALGAGECHFYACFLFGKDVIGPDGGA
jgi:L-fucose mutarotase/ribose pyranase (RbsD/FucU family)